MFSSGYLANLGAVTALAGAGSLVVSDAQNHASLVDACRLARGDVVVTAAPGRRPPWTGRWPTGVPSTAVVVTDAVFSVDGDLAPLAELHRVARAPRRAAGGRRGARARRGRAGGPGGRGRRGHRRRARRRAHADAVASRSAPRAGRCWATPSWSSTWSTPRGPFIFDTGLAPPSAAAALGRAGGAARRAGARGRGAGPGPGPGGGAGRRRAAGHRADRRGGLGARRRPGPGLRGGRRLRADGIRVGCFRPPSVPDGVSRLRLTARADLTDDQVALAVHAVRAVLADPALV